MQNRTFTGVEVQPIPLRQMLTDEVHSRLSVMIVSSEIPPDARINIESVARQLGVSPTPVREALARLESDGLVEKLPLKGYRTTNPLNREEILELFEVRLLLEPFAAARAATTTDAAPLLQREINRGADAVATHYTADFAGHDARFHDLLFDEAANETLHRAYTRLHVHLHTFRLSYDDRLGSQTLEEHRAVADAVAAHTPEAASAAMVLHLDSSRARILDRLGWDPLATR